MVRSLQVIQFLNRLSDYFFVAARYVTMVEGEKEITYKKSKA